MFQPTTIFALLSLTTSTFSAPTELKKRYTCYPEVPAAECTARATWFYACEARNEPDCLNKSLDITTADSNQVPPVTPIQKRYTCLPTVPAVKCTAQTAYWDRCLVLKILSESECYEQAQIIEDAMNDLINPDPSPEDNSLKKRYTCLPTEPAADCTAKSEYFNRCIDAKILSDRQCYEQSQSVTATTNELVIPANPIPYTVPGLEASPIPVKPDTLTNPPQKRYTCPPTVPAADCTAKSEYFNQCIAAGKLAEECAELSQQVTATTTVLSIPENITPYTGDLEASPIPVKPDTLTNPPQKRFTCPHTVPAADCTAKSEYFNQCIADGKLAEECAELSQQVTATTTVLSIPENITPYTGDLEASPIPVKPNTLVK
ncbi:hypothetical protein E2P81_ATG09020 [Venturia nashicola]|uniref:Uncharacterized protein n=1 Tax=Venturia nashicola TaxID=86259 RepID=A0A4Z1P6V2_9PEZI|nr:hypothetical protein E6O75_ATG09220 [Venturia nashicola]TLD23676.1 hypothetical protein E2P81_ATG09020 [Venturia nashicola]